MILTDTFIIENAELLIEQRQGKTIRRLRGIFGRCDEKNNNGRVYSKPLLEREVKRISEAMSERRLLGELDHPTHDAVKLSNVSHLITGLDFNGRELMGECELLDTPAGKVAQALVEGGVKIGISSRGMGTLSEHADGTKHVNEDYKLVTFDLVADPSTRGAFPGITESSLVEEIVKDTLDKAAKEKVFTTMLKDKLREKLDINQKPAPYKSARQHQKDADEKHPKKPTAEDPFRNWDYFYGPYTGKPRIVKTRGYPDAESVTAPAEVVENKYGILRDILSENKRVDKKKGDPDWKEVGRSFRWGAGEGREPLDQGTTRVIRVRTPRYTGPHPQGSAVARRQFKKDHPDAKPATRGEAVEVSNYGVLKSILEVSIKMAARAAGSARQKRPHAVPVGRGRNPSLMEPRDPERAAQQQKDTEGQIQRIKDKLTARAEKKHGKAPTKKVFAHHKEEPNEDAIAHMKRLLKAGLPHGEAITGPRRRTVAVYKDEPKRTLYSGGRKETRAETVDRKFEKEAKKAERKSAEGHPKYRAPGGLGGSDALKVRKGHKHAQG